MKLPLKLEKGLIVRNPRMSDIKSMMSHINNLVDENVDLLMNKKVKTLSEEKKKVSDILEKIKSHRAVFLLVLDKNKVVGESGIFMLKGKSGHVGSLGISIARDYRNKGLGQKLMRLIISQAKVKLKDIELVELEVFKRNKRAIHVYEKMGFKRVGIRPRVVKTNGKYHDLLIMHKWLKKC